MSGGRSPERRPRNRILTALSDEEYARLAPRLERVALELKRVLVDVDRPIEHVYFPENCVVSIVSVMADGTAVETATVGWEGMVGLPLFHGTDSTAAQAFCQIQGEALRMDARTFRAEIARNGTLTRMLHRYSQALLTLVGQSSACNRVHTMEERLARWLLHSVDRVGVETFPLTHQFMSQMLGVRRATVTVAAGALQRAGLIEYVMGKIRVLDRPGLESAACECYGIITREFDRLLEGTTPPSPLEGVTTSKGGKSAVGDGAPREKASGDGRDGEG